MRILLSVLGVLVLGLPAHAVAPSAATETVRNESPKPVAKRTDEAAKKKAEAERKKAAAALAAKQKAATQKTQKPGTTAKASPDSALGSAGRRAILSQRAGQKGKSTAKSPPRVKS